MMKQLSLYSAIVPNAIGPQLSRILDQFAGQIEDNYQGNFLYDAKKGLQFVCHQTGSLLNFNFNQYLFKFLKQGPSMLRGGPFYKAIGQKKFKQLPYVWDCTGGTGKDLIFMYALGIRKIKVFERNKVLALLLADAIDRFEEDHQIELVATDCMQETRKPNIELPQVLYYDPMFTFTKKRKALPRIEMQIFDLLFSAEPQDKSEAVINDDDAILRWAVEKKVKRIVVKRGIKSPALLNNKTAELKGNSVRFDLYCP